jgi:hypothetical protein
VKNHKGLRPWADRLAVKHEFIPVVPSLPARLDSGCFDSVQPAAEISERIHSRHQVENLIQKEKIAEALNNARTQMLVREYYRPEYFIWSLELKEDELRFGFSRQSRLNKFKKHTPNMSFDRASDRFYEFFDTRLSVYATDISALSKREE